MANEEKLDWIYKGANSLVDREDYLLGRKIDKTLEQLNEEEKEKKFVLPTPKNHVEHECIPPSIRDFNKIVQAEQVDLSAKLQEDPLVAIKKREEEVRRQFLQNPVQLKKLQDALKKKEDSKKKPKKSKRKHDKDLDEQIKQKLKNLKSFPLQVGPSKKEAKKDKEDVLNTILMHKFNALKDKLSEKDLNDILNGKCSDTSEEEEDKRKNNSSEVDSEEDQKRRRRQTGSSNNRYRKSVSGYKNKRKISNESSDEESSNIRKTYRSTNRNIDYKPRSKMQYDRRPNRRSRSRSVSKEAKRSNRNQSRDRKSKMHDEEHYYQRGKLKNKERNNSSPEDDSRARKSLKKTANEDSDSELDRKIMMKLKLLRGEAENSSKTKKQSDSSSSSSDSESEVPSKKVCFPERPKHLNRNESSSSDERISAKNSDKYQYYDSEDEKTQIKSFGLVSADGKKIALGKSETYKKTKAGSSRKLENTVKPDEKKVKKLTEQEKERLRKEMMSNAKARDKEREETVKRYREKYKREEETVSSKYDADLVHTELLKSAKHSSVEQRIKSKMNTIQRSSRHMESHFSKRL